MPKWRLGHECLHALKGLEMSIDLTLHLYNTASIFISIYGGYKSSYIMSKYVREATIIKDVYRSYIHAWECSKDSRLHQRICYLICYHNMRENVKVHG